MATTNLNLTIVKEVGNGSALSTEGPASPSSEVRAQQAATTVFTPPVNLVPTQGQEAKRQFTPVPTTLVNGPKIQAPLITTMIPDEDDDDEYFDPETSMEESEQSQDVDALDDGEEFFDCQDLTQEPEYAQDVHTFDDVEEANLFDCEDLTQEYEHAKDIVRTLTSILKNSWDAEHSEEESWESTLQEIYDSAQEKYAEAKDASISVNSKELASIAVSKFVAQEAGLPEYCCPQFPWENKEGVENTEQLVRWQALKKTCLLNGAALEQVQSVEDSEEGSQTQLQTGLSYLQNGLSYLSTTITSNRVGLFFLGLCALSALPLATAAAVPILVNATSVCVPGVSAVFGGCGAAATNTVASGTFIGEVASAVGGLVPYAAQTLGGAASALVPYVVPVCTVVTSPIVTSLLGDGVLNATTNFTNTSLPMCNLGDAPAITGAVTNASWLGNLGYAPTVIYSMSQARNALTAASDGNYGTAGANLVRAALPLAATYLGGPVAGAAAAAVLSAAERLLIAPTDTATAPPAESKLYEKRNVVCKKGIFNIKVPGPAGLSPEEEKDLIKAFISEVLDQNPVNTIVGDKIEFQFPESKKWTVQVTRETREGHAETLESVKTYTESPSDRNSIKKLETLRKVMGGAHAFAVMQPLHSITMDRIPNNAPTVSPVAFTNAHPALCSSMRAMLAIPEIRTAMEQSNHSEVNRIANAYGGSDPLDLANLERALNPRTLDVEGYENALRDLMVIDSLDDLSKLLIPKLQINDQLYANTIATNWHKAKKIAPIFPKLEISPSATEESLQTLVNANQRQGTSQTQFYSIPHSLQISVAAATGTNRAVTVNVDEATGTDQAATVDKKLELLDLDWHYIEANAPETPQGNDRINNNEPNNNKPKYSLQNMILHTDQGDVTYQRTVENVNGEPQIFYWKFDPTSEIDAPICIDFDEFQQAANSEDKKDLFFLKQEAGAVRAEEVLGEERYDSDSAPNLAEEAYNASFKYDNTFYNMTLPPYDRIKGAVEGNNPNTLKAAVMNALQIAATALEAAEEALQTAVDNGLAEEEVARLTAVRNSLTEITLPVPVGDAANGMNWPIGIMWFAAQEFMQTQAGSEFKVRLAIDKSKKQGERRAHLVDQIDMAETIYLQHQWQGASPEPTAHALARFTNFTRDWKAYSKPPAPRRGFPFY